MNFTKSELKVDSLAVNVNVVDVTAAKTITALENGTTFSLNAAAGAVLTLPAPARGLKYKFVVGALFATTDWVITATGAIMQGAIMEASTVQAVANATTINLELGAETLGDWVSLESDGTNWFVAGACTGAAATPA